jgi:hypothetical protein
MGIGQSKVARLLQIEQLHDITFSISPFASNFTFPHWQLP